MSETVETKLLVPKLRFPEFRGTSSWHSMPLSVAARTITNGDANSEDHVEGGRYPLFDRSVTVKASDKCLFNAKAIILPGEGASFPPRMYDGKFALHQRAYALMDFTVRYEFLSYAMDSTKGTLASNAVESTVRSLRLPIIAKHLVPVPSQAEQRKIAGCLQSLDALIAAETEKLEALKRHKKGLLQQLFPAEGQITPRLRFPQFRNAPEWTTKPLASLCAINTGKKDVNQGSATGPYPFFTCADAVSRSDSFSFDTEAVLVAGNANVGQSKYYKGKFEAYQRTYVLSNFQNAAAKYVFVVLDTLLQLALRSQVQTSAMSYITLPVLSDFPVQMPPSDAEMEKIVAFHLSLSTTVEVMARRLASLRSHKAALMQQLFPSLEEQDATAG